MADIELANVSKSFGKVQVIDNLPPTVVGLARPAGALPSARFAALLEHVHSTATL